MVVATPFLVGAVLCTLAWAYAGIRIALDREPDPNMDLRRKLIHVSRGMSTRRYLLVTAVSGTVGVVLWNGLDDIIGWFL